MLSCLGAALCESSRSVIVIVQCVYGSVNHAWSSGRSEGNLDNGLTRCLGTVGPKYNGVFRSLEDRLPELTRAARCM